jgi:RNA polymerase sigma factor (sigma-70 family)
MATMHVEHRALDHEHEAARLFAEHADWLLGFCRRRVCSAADAEDAVQTTFLYALRALRRGVRPDCEEAWLTAIAKNVCLTQHRTLERRGACAVDLDLDRIGLAVPEDGEPELLLGLAEALASLPETQRTALVLRDFRGAPAQEIADTLHLSSTAAQALVTRARRSLRRALVAPRSLAGLGLPSFLHRLEAALRGLADGGATKAAAATVAVAVTLGGGGAAPAERTPASDAPRPQRAVSMPTVRATPVVVVGSDPVTSPRATADRRTARAPRPARGFAVPTPDGGTTTGAASEAPAADQSPGPVAGPPAPDPPAAPAPPAAEPPRQGPLPPPPAFEPPELLPPLPPLPPLPVLPELPEVPPLLGEPELPLDLAPLLPDTGLPLLP